MAQYNKRPYSVTFGDVDDMNRGDKKKLMNPPITINDDYYWLRDDERTNPEIIEIIKNENITYENNLNKEKIQELEDSINSRMTKDYDTHPVPNNITSPYTYFARMIDGNDYPVYYRQTHNNQDTMLLDVNVMAKDVSHCDIPGLAFNNLENIMSYGVDYNGSELYEIVLSHVLKDGTIAPIQSLMESVKYANYQWLTSRLIIFVREDENNRPFEIAIYDVYMQITKTIYTETNENYEVCMYTSTDNTCLFIQSGNYDENMLYYNILGDNNFTSLDTMDFTLTPIWNIKPKTLVTGDYHNRMFYFLTNDDAINYKVVTCMLQDDQLKQDLYIPILPYNENVTITSFSINKYHIVMQITHNGANYIARIKDSRITVFNLHGYSKIIPMTDWQNVHGDMNNDQVYNISSAMYTHDSDMLMVTDESLTVSKSLHIIKFNDNFTFESKNVWTKIVPNYDSSLYTSERMYAKSHDGTMVPISMMYRKDKRKPGHKMPLYMYGYGAYGLTIDPKFSYTNIALLDKGFCFAICHIRGGAFLGQHWYEDGRLAHKQNTFYDFIHCRHHLATLPYIDSDNITCEGRSAGGLLTGVMVSKYHNYFKNIILGVPFVDVLITMRDSSIPLTTEEWTQWGNPNIREDFNRMMEYCPYNNLQSAPYPNIFITTGFNDPRVQYWEGLKFLAKIRELNTNPLSIQCIETQMGQGHFGNSGRYNASNDSAKKFSLIM